jgi:SAM-dependent methyltransferase
VKDFFSEQSADYAAARPHYPDELFIYISGLCSGHQIAWDCGTGNGQTAAALARYFKEVYATDISEKQLAQASRIPNVTYKIESAEDCSLQDASTDLVTVSTAVHWFNLDLFYMQVDRILKSGGILAVWSYAGCRVSESIDVLLDDYAFRMLYDYWPPETRYNWQDKYKSLPFPYALIPSPEFTATGSYNLIQLTTCLNSWSASQSYRKRHGTDPLELIYKELLQAWGDPKTVRKVSWPLFLKCGRKPL